MNPDAEPKGDFQFSPALMQAADAYLKATQDPSKQCFQNVYPEATMRWGIHSEIKEALQEGKTEAEIIEQMNKMAAE